MKTILTVDDSPSIRQMLAYVLSSNGYRVIEAGDGEEGLTLARKHRPDMIMLDIGLPTMDGLELIQILRRETRVPGRAASGSRRHRKRS